MVWLIFIIVPAVCMFEPVGNRGAWYMIVIMLLFVPLLVWMQQKSEDNIRAAEDKEWKAITNYDNN